MAYIALDVEATGLDIHKNEMVSVGAVDIETGKRFYVECKPDNFDSIDDQALKVNGFTIEQLRNIKSTKKEALEALISFLAGFDEPIIVGYYVSFDVAMLYAAAEATGIDIGSLPKKCIDDAEIVVKEFYHKSRVIPQNAVIKRGGQDYVRASQALTVLLNMENEPKPHNALNGAIYSGEIFSRIVMHKPLGSSTSPNKEIPQTVNGVDISVWDYLRNCREVASEYKSKFDSNII